MKRNLEPLLGTLQCNSFYLASSKDFGKDFSAFGCEPGASFEYGSMLRLAVAVSFQEGPVSLACWNPCPCVVPSYTE